MVELVDTKEEEEGEEEVMEFIVTVKMDILGHFAKIVFFFFFFFIYLF